jgi:hypothetical protein
MKKLGESTTFPISPDAKPGQSLESAPSPSIVRTLIPVALPACGDNDNFKLENEMVTALLGGILPLVSDSKSAVLPTQDELADGEGNIPLIVALGVKDVLKKPEGYVNVIRPFKLLSLEYDSPPPADVVNVSRAPLVTLPATRSSKGIKKLAFRTTSPMLPDANPRGVFESAPSPSIVRTLIPVALPACGDDDSPKLENEMVTALLAGILPPVSDSTSAVLPTHDELADGEGNIPLIVALGDEDVLKKPEGYVNVIRPFKLLSLEYDSPPPADVVNVSRAPLVTLPARRSSTGIEKRGESTTSPMLPVGFVVKQLLVGNLKSPPACGKDDNIPRHVMVKVRLGMSWDPR